MEPLALPFPDCCRNCGRQIERSGRRGRPPVWCSDDCRTAAGVQSLTNDYGAQRLAYYYANRDRILAGRRKEREARDLGPCGWCRRSLSKDSRRYKYCSDPCAEAARAAKGHGFARAKASAHVRGYGKTHQALRAKLLPLAYGKPCHLCGEVMQNGDALHLDHTEDRTGYRGFAHAACNLRDGARRGNRKRREKVLREGWRPGQDPSARRRFTRTSA